MAVRTANKAMAALSALKALQEDAKRKGLEDVSAVCAPGNRQHFPERLGNIRIVPAREFLSEVGF